MKPSLRLVGVIMVMLSGSFLTVADSNVNSASNISENNIKSIEVNSRANEHFGEVIITEDKKEVLAANIEEEEEVIEVAPEVTEEEVQEEIVYKDMTYDELVEKLNRSLYSSLAGKGEVFASYALENNVDPYLAVSISLLETGCKWGCSTLVTKCNNVGGQHGGPKLCGSGPYGKFATLDKGIEAFIVNISENYVNVGLDTPEKMNSKYAASSTWAKKVRKYMQEIENN